MPNMIEFFHQDRILTIKSNDNKYVYVDYENEKVSIWNMLIDSPWEYEKSWILLEVKDFWNNLFYSFLIDWKVIFVLLNDNFESKEEIWSFFWDIDVLLIHSTKNSQKVIENIETRVVIPVGEWKDILLHTLWQHKVEIENYKFKSDTPDDSTEFINLK